MSLKRVCDLCGEVKDTKLTLGLMEKSLEHAKNLRPEAHESGVTG